MRESLSIDVRTGVGVVWEGGERVFFVLRSTELDVFTDGELLPGCGVSGISSKNCVSPVWLSK